MLAILFRKWHLFLILNFLLKISVFSEEINYNIFSSFEELILYETSQIAGCYSGNYEDLSNAYINRGESYLLAEKYELAVEDLQSGYEFALLCDLNVKSVLLLRSLFGLVFSYGIMNEMDEFHLIEQEIKNIFDAFSCRKTEKRQDLNQTVFHSRYSATASNVEKPIYGPDKISTADCVDRARGIARASRILILKAKLEVQTFLNILIDDLEDRAIRCCVAGGLWKACLQPILNKWQKWNEKWKLLGIPPDPAWD